MSGVMSKSRKEKGTYKQEIKKFLACRCYFAAKDIKSDKKK